MFVNTKIFDGKNWLHISFYTIRSNVQLIFLCIFGKNMTADKQKIQKGRK